MPMSTTQIVSEAIASSKAHNEIAHIRSGGGVHPGWLPAIHEELLAECEDSADVEGAVEYWGRDVDGDGWRVRVEVSS